MKWQRPAPLGEQEAPKFPGEADWLCPGWEVPAGFCVAWEAPLPAGEEAKEAWILEACRRQTKLARLGEKAAWAFVKQVHGVALKRAEGLGAGEVHCLGEADGVWTAQPGLALGIQTADCVPLLLMDKKQRRVAAVHAGWRGVWGRIGVAMLQAWQQEGSHPEDIQVALGPCIGPCCYEVSEDLAQQFLQRWGAQVVQNPVGAKGPSLDLAKALELDMVGAGLSPKQLQSAQLCTSCDMRFHSHRRAQGRAGRQLSWVQCFPPWV